MFEIPDIVVLSLLDEAEFNARKAKVADVSANIADLEA